jgi:2-oxo-4-hydroxy-4-carboxy--5-ureidoimidazoline (OHCU) decarboxylase
MGRQPKKINNTIRLILSIIFLLTQLGIDIRPVHSALPQMLPLPNPSEITIPEAYGKITEAFKGDSDKLVFHIQDLHTNPEAQLNSAKIMEYLMNTYGVKLLTIEGEATRFNPEWIANVSLIRPINDKMADILLRAGLMTGEEHLYATQYPKYKDVVFWGIEDKDSYRKNREVFNRMYPKIRENLRLCDNLKRTLDKLKEKIYPEEALELDEKRTSYEEKELEVKDYTSFLTEQAKQNGIDLSKFENFSILAKLVDIQEKLEFSRVDKERTLLFDGLSKVLTEEQSKELMDKVKEQNEGKLTAIEFYSYLRNTATDNGLNFSEYPSINTYMEYIATSDKLDNTQLFKELTQVEDDIIGSLLTTDEQKRLARFSKIVSIMKRSFDINMSNEDLDFYQKNKEDFKIQAFSDFIKETAMTHNIRYSLDPSISQLDGRLLEQDEFYEVVLVRDEAMVNNTVKRMDETGTNITIQPIGGFHTKGMMKMYKEKNISYVVISPHVTKEFDEEGYRNILLDKRKTVEQLISEYGGTLRPSGATTSAETRKDAVALAVYLARDMFKDDMLPEEAVRAALMTINPDFANLLAQNPEFTEIVADLRNEKSGVAFDDLTQPEKDYYQSLNIDLSDVIFVTGFGWAAAALYDKASKKRIVHRWWGLAGIVNSKIGTTPARGKWVAAAIKHIIDGHEGLHRDNPDTDEKGVLKKEVDLLLAKPEEERADIIMGMQHLTEHIAKPHFVGDKYIQFVFKSVNDDHNLKQARRDMIDSIDGVVYGSRTIVELVEGQEKEAIKEAVIDGDGFAKIATSINVRIPQDIIAFDVATLLGTKGPRDLAGLRAIADKLQGKTIYLINTYDDRLSNRDIELLLGLEGSGINYEVVPATIATAPTWSKASSVQQFVILKDNFERFEKVLSVIGKKPIFVDINDAEEPTPVISIYSILLALGLVFDEATLGNLAKYLQQGGANDNYSAVIGAQPAQTFGEQYQKFLLERIQR